MILEKHPYNQKIFCRDVVYNIQHPQMLRNDQGYLKQLEKQHARYYAGLPREVQQSFQYYSGDGYQSINDYLRGLPVRPDSGSPEDFIQMIKNHVERIESALSNSPPLTKALEVCRGVRLEDSKRYQTGDVLNLFQNGFTSTSFDLEVASSFGGPVCCLFLLYLPPGTRGLYLGKKSTQGGEFEYLLAPGSLFKIISKGKESIPLRNASAKYPQLMTYRATCLNCEPEVERRFHQVEVEGQLNPQYLQGLSPEVIRELNRLSSQCEQPNMILNPKTNRCVRIDGKVGKDIIAYLIGQFQ